MRRLAYLLLGLGALALGAYLIARALLGSDLVRSAIEAQLEQRLGEPVQVGAAGAAIFPRIAVVLHDVRIGEPEAVRLGTVRVVTGLRGLLSRRIEDAEIVVSDSRIELPPPFPLALAAPAEGAPPATADPAFRIVSVRVIALRDVTFAAGEEEARVGLRSSIDGDRLEVARLTAQARRTRLEASGTLTSMARLEGSFEARADPLDLEELVAFGAALSAPSSAGLPAGGATMPMDISLTLAAPAVRFSTYQLRDLAVEARIVPGRFRLAPLTVGLFGGTATGQLEVETTGPAPRLRLSGRMEDLDVADLLAQEGGGGAGITGRLGGTVSLTAAGADADALLRTGRGTLQAAIRDGELPGMDLVRTVVLAFGRPAGAPPEGSGSTFSRLGGTFALAGGTLTSENVAMTSRDFDLAGRVTLNLLNRKLDARVNVVLSKELTAQAGTDLRRYAQEDGRIVMPATITGTLDRAVVSLDLAAAAKRAVEGELRRRTKSLFDKLLRDR